MEYDSDNIQSVVFIEPKTNNVIIKGFAIFVFKKFRLSVIWQRYKMEFYKIFNKYPRKTLQTFFASNKTKCDGK